MGWGGGAAEGRAPAECGLGAHKACLVDPTTVKKESCQSHLPGKRKKTESSLDRMSTHSHTHTRTRIHIQRQDDELCCHP